jgi:tagatose 1,6-diphosphate aldolase
MQKISIGKYRGLQQISSKLGSFTALALDHRQNLRKANPAFIEDQELSDFKMDVTRTLAPYANAVLLDPEVAAAQAIAEGILPKGSGLVVSLESTGYTGEADARKPQVIPGWSVKKAKLMGASAVKLLVYYHPESATAASTEDFVKQLLEECQREDIVLMLETLSYPVDGSPKLDSASKRKVVIETARVFGKLAIDILKSEFPLTPENTNEKEWLAACTEISAVCPRPWILLSAAVDFSQYLQQVIAACESGASGIAVGRAVWKEAVILPKSERLQYLQETAIPRLARLTALSEALAKPWTDFYRADAPFDWVRTYAEN